LGSFSLGNPEHIGNLSGGRDYIINILSWNSEKRALLKSYFDADIVISCGGGYFTDNFGPVFLGSVHELMLALILRKKIFVCAQSIGPLRMKYSRSIIRWVLDKADIITFRERYRLTLRKKLGLRDLFNFLHVIQAFY